jgi:hypothetical protein
MKKTILTVALLAMTTAVFAGPEAGAARKSTTTTISATEEQREEALKKAHEGKIKQTGAGREQHGIKEESGPRLESAPESHNISAVTSRSAAGQ